jgi:hypothetical protein
MIAMPIKTTGVGSGIGLVKSVPALALNVPAFLRQIK